MLVVRLRGFVVILSLLILAGFVPGLQTSFAVAQTGSPSAVESLRDDVAGMKKDLEEIKKDLKSIRELLTQRLARPTPAVPTVARVSLADNPMLGKPDAPITLIEFSDYQCPFCKRFFQTTLPALKTEYIETGKLRYVFRDFPLDQIHSQARKAAEAAHCAGEQGKYWEMHDLLFENQKALAPEQLQAYARDLQLDATAFDTCVTEGKYSTKVQKDYADGAAAGVRGTPGFFLGKTEEGDTIQGMAISGAQPVAVFRKAIEELLQEKP